MVGYTRERYHRDISVPYLYKDNEYTSNISRCVSPTHRAQPRLVRTVKLVRDNRFVNVSEKLNDLTPNDMCSRLRK